MKLLSNCLYFLGVATIAAVLFLSVIGFCDPTRSPSDFITKSILFVTIGFMMVWLSDIFTLQHNRTVTIRSLLDQARNSRSAFLASFVSWIVATGLNPWSRGDIAVSVGINLALAFLLLTVMQDGAVRSRIGPR